jgi:hypothetical protein
VLVETSWRLKPEEPVSVDWDKGVLQVGLVVFGLLFQFHVSFTGMPLRYVEPSIFTLTQITLGTLLCPDIPAMTPILPTLPRDAARLYSGFFQQGLALRPLIQAHSDCRH